MDKQQTYEAVRKEIAAVIQGETSEIARYASAACLLHQTFDYFFWTGFYLVDRQKRANWLSGPIRELWAAFEFHSVKGFAGLVLFARKRFGLLMCMNSQVILPVTADQILK